MTVTNDLPRQSRAIVVRNFGQMPSIEHVPIPRDIEPGAVIVKVDSASVCGTDNHLVGGELDLRVDLPVILGHEMAGTVVAFGEGSNKDSFGTDLELGDRLVWSHASCKQCHLCVNVGEALCMNKRSYMYESCEVYPYLLGGFTEYAYVLPTAGRLKIPDHVSSELASISSCALRSVVNSLEQAPAIRPLDTVVVQGAGPLGIFSTCLAAISGAANVVVIGGPQSRLEIAKRFGATAVLSLEDTTAAERLAFVRDLTGGYGADFCLEMSGNVRAFGEGVDLLRPAGTYVLVGALSSETTPVAPGLLVRKNLKVLGSVSATISHYRRGLDILATFGSRFPFEELITKRLPIARFEEGLKAAGQGSDMKVVFDCQDWGDR